MAGYAHMLKQRGWSLIELMLSLSLGLLITGSALGLLLTTLRASRDALDLARLNQDVRHLANGMQRDFLRAGYWQSMHAVVQASARCELQITDTGGGSTTIRSVLAASAAPCTAFGTPLSANMLQGRSLVISYLDGYGAAAMQSLRVDTLVDASRLMASGSAAALPSRIPAGSWTISNPFASVVQLGDCLVFGYDEDGDGLRGDQEWFGYRMDTSAHAVRGVNNAHSCNSGDWENISDERTVYVSSLSFLLPFSSLQAGAGADLRRHSTRFRLEARLRRDARVDRQIQAEVRVRNDAQAW